MTDHGAGFEAITLTIDDRIARLTLNRPETLNALNDAMFAS